MPNGETHRIVGTLVGAGYSWYRSNEEEGGSNVARMIGGAIGGHLGGTMPDLIEPASMPQHRQVAHSIAIGLALAFGTKEMVDDWEASCRDQAMMFREITENEEASVIEKIVALIGEVFCEVAAGIPGGFVAGYTSHLVLDGIYGELPLLGNLDRTFQVRQLHIAKLNQKLLKLT